MSGYLRIGKRSAPTGQLLKFLKVSKGNGKVWRCLIILISWYIIYLSDIVQRSASVMDIACEKKE